MDSLERLEEEIISCRRCRRLVSYRQEVAEKRPPRYREWNYWARPLPGFGDPQARVLIFGLAPAAHGGNRTGRMFTGDRSGDLLIRTLYRFGFANQMRSEHREDGLALQDVYLTATLRCAPLQNKPSPSEMAACRRFLLRELGLLRSARVWVALGRVAFHAALNAFQETHQVSISPKPAFGHGQVHSLANGYTLIASFHPSQQNTQTGRLTPKMFNSIFDEARSILRKMKEVT